jgi:hypothetical protein
MCDPCVITGGKGHLTHGSHMDDTWLSESTVCYDFNKRFDYQCFNIVIITCLRLTTQKTLQKRRESKTTKRVLIAAFTQVIVLPAD